MSGRRQLLQVLLGGAITLLAAPGNANMPIAAVPVQGQLVSRSRGPVPGMTLFLVHRVFGRSAPAYSDAGGRFGWAAIPVSAEPYFLEVYWGSSLMYRQPIQVGGPLALPQIFL
jgi:hypothetical protein